MTPGEIIHALTPLLEASEYGERCLQRYAERIGSAELRMALYTRSIEWKITTRELRAMIAKYGGEKSGRSRSRSASLRECPAESSRTMPDEELVNEYLHDEEVAMTRYVDALRCDLPTRVRGILSRQYQDVLSSHVHIRSLRKR